MSLVDNCDNLSNYLPHHPVFEGSTTLKTRVVFDASTKTDKGISLNDSLFTGPTILDKLTTHLFRFHAHTFVLTADIEKM